MSASKRTINRVRALWLDNKYYASFTSANTFYDALKRDGKIRDIKFSEVRDVLETIPSYQMHFRRKKKFETRHLNFVPRNFQSAVLSGSQISMMCDLAQMPESDGWNWILVLVDLWSNFIIAEPLKTKSPVEVLKTLKEIIKTNNLTKFSTLGTDEGIEFTANRAALKKIGINLYHVRGKHKAFLAERYIQVIKSRLYKLLRAKFKDAWPKVLQQTVSNINSTPNKALGLPPAEVNSPLSDPLVREIRQKREIERVPSKLESVRFVPNDYVYVDFEEKSFGRGFDTKRGMTYVVDSVNTTTKPYFYSIKEVDNTPIRKKYYAWQLRKSTDPNTEELPVESVIDERKVGRKKQYFVKFLNWPSKYNMWVDSSLLVK